MSGQSRLPYGLAAPGRRIRYGPPYRCCPKSGTSWNAHPLFHALIRITDNFKIFIAVHSQLQRIPHLQVQNSLGYFKQILQLVVSAHRHSGTAPADCLFRGMEAHNRTPVRYSGVDDFAVSCKRSLCLLLELLAAYFIIDRVRFKSV